MPIFPSHAPHMSCALSITCYFSQMETLTGRLVPEANSSNRECPHFGEPRCQANWLQHLLQPSDSSSSNCRVSVQHGLASSPNSSSQTHLAVPSLMHNSSTRNPRDIYVAICGMGMSNNVRIRPT